MLGQSRRRARPHAGLAVEQQLLVLGGLLEAVHVLKVLLGEMEALHRGCDGDGDGAGDLAGFLELDDFADI